MQNNETPGGVWGTCHGEMTTGSAQIYISPGSSMIGKRQHLGVYSEDEFEEKDWADGTQLCNLCGGV
jgi:hypothetical protein